MIVILDFGSQYTQLIARKVRAEQVSAIILPYNAEPAEILAHKPAGLILSGGPASVHQQGSPQLNPAILEWDIPILGVCYGMQALAHSTRGRVAAADRGEYGPAQIVEVSPDPLFKDFKAPTQVWMSHRDAVLDIPPGWRALARTENCPNAAMRHLERPWWGLQFHPEVHHTTDGRLLLRNFARDICSAPADWDMSQWTQRQIASLRERAAGRQVVAAVSGGVDSTVMAVLLARALGDNLRCFFVDNGLLRLREAGEVLEQFRRLDVKVEFVDARRRFLDPLAGVEEPEQKRRIIGRVFIEVLGEHLGPKDILAQGTLYPDQIESVSQKGPSATIKTHHNRVSEVLGLMKEGRIIEPLADLFKDEVREVGAALGIPREALWRHPFPGPGLAVRILGAVEERSLEILRLADRIVTDELKAANLYYDATWQAFAVLLPVRSVGVMGDERTYENVAAIRAVTSTDGMTADWARLPYDVLARMSSRIINEVRGVNRVVYDISSKPPSTIEWE